MNENLIQTDPLESAQSVSRRVPKGMPRILIGIVMAIIIVGGGVFAYTQVLANPPKRLFRKALENFQNVSSYSYQGHLETVITPPDEGEEKTRYKLDFSGSSVKGENPKSSLSTTFSMSLPKNIAQGEASLGLDLRTFRDDTIYLKLSKLSLPPGVQQILDPSFTQTILDKWFVITQEGLFDQYQTLSSSTDTPSYEKLRDSLKLTSEEEDRLIDLFLDPLIPEKENSEQIDGVNTHHYRITSDPVKREAFVREAVRMYFSKIESAYKNTEEMSEEDKENFIKGATFLLGKLSGEVWVGKSDLLIRKLVLVFDITKEDSKDLNRLLGGGSMEDQTFNGLYLSMSLEFSQYNQPFEVEEPAGAILLSDLLKNLFQVSLPAVPSQ